MKKKLNLDHLKVKSFVTSVEGGLENTVKGGISGGACVPVEKYTDRCLKTVELDCVYTRELCAFSELC